jgi:hypothetical protein
MKKHNAIKIAVLETLVMTDKSNEVCEALPAQGDATRAINQFALMNEDDRKTKRSRQRL